MLQRNIDWQFNSPAGSHHGGVWERIIRSVRKVMNSVLREQVLDDEGLHTLMSEIEAILNSRPITRNSDNHSDLEPFTPNHLLLMKQEPNLRPGIFNKCDNYSRRRWRQIRYMANLFWSRWVREYLPLFKERQKWHEVKRNMKCGDVVLIVDSNASRNSWPMGVIPDKGGLYKGYTTGGYRKGEGYSKEEEGYRKGEGYSKGEEGYRKGEKDKAKKDIEKERRI